MLTVIVIIIRSVASPGGFAILLSFIALGWGVSLRWKQDQFLKEQREGVAQWEKNINLVKQSHEPSKVIVESFKLAAIVNISTKGDRLISTWARITDAGLIAEDVRVGVRFVMLNGPESILYHASYEPRFHSSTVNRATFALHCVNIRYTPLDNKWMPIRTAYQEYCFDTQSERGEFWRQFNIAYKMWQEKYGPLMKIRGQLPAMMDQWKQLDQYGCGAYHDCMYPKWVMTP